MEAKFLAITKESWMSLRIASEKKEESEKEQIYVSFTDLYERKQLWLEEQLNKGHRVFLTPKKGRVLEIKLVEYR
jgi:hypothetical protein